MLKTRMQQSGGYKCEGMGYNYYEIRTNQLLSVDYHIFLDLALVASVSRYIPQLGF